MLRSVKRPDGEVVNFEYDPLGRRISKQYRGTTTRWVWDGNVPLHEWAEESDVTTWLFEESTFVPAAKIVGDKSYSIITDYLGTPTHAFDSKGNKVWERNLDIYGKIRTGNSTFVPFLYQGQYFDAEIDLCYNRFRYYSPDEGTYISQDPIGLAGNNPTIYGYVFDSNTEIDPFGLDAIPNKVAGNAREAIARTWLENKFPNAEILSERYIRDINGKSVRDISGSRRRLDFVVVEDGKVKGIFEVTSPTADKTAQMLKEADIRGNGGTRVKAPGRKGALYDISDIETQRLDVDLETKKVKCH
ncbi:RHS repeat domain-containing protein [Porphyromonas gulae]